MFKCLTLALGFLPFFVFGQSDENALALQKTDSLIQVSRAFTDKKEFDKALETSALAEKEALEKWGRESAPYASVCFNFGRIFQSKGGYAEAEKWFMNAKNIREKVLGKEHLDYLITLRVLGHAYLDLKNFALAEQMYLEYKNLSEQTKRPEEYAMALGNLALLYDEMGYFEKAESAYLESIALREKHLGKENMEYATTINNLGLTYLKNGQYEKSGPLLWEGRQIRERVLGKKHPHYSSSLNNLADLYTKTANYEKALPLAIEAKELRAIVLGKSNPRYGWSLNNLANLYALMGNYEQAEPLFLEALEIKANTLGKAHSDYGKGLGNLSILYRLMGNYEKAEILGLEALPITEKMLGKEHPEYLADLTNMGNLYLQTGMYEKSEAYHLEAKRITKEKLGTDHPDYGNCLSDLGNLYLSTGAYAQAEAHFLEADSFMKKGIGTEHPFYATNLHALALTHQYAGRFEQAEPLFLQAKAIREKNLGTAHPDYSQSLDHLAQFYWASGKLDLAKSYIVASDESEKKLLIKASRHLSEQELSSYIRKFENGLDRDFSFAQVQSGMAATCYDNILFHKGFLLNAVSQTRQLALTDSATTEQYLQLKSFERRLAAEYAKPLLDKKTIGTLQDKANDLEKELTRQVAGFGEASRQVKWEDVQQRLQPGEAAIEFVQYKCVSSNPLALSNPKNRKADSVRYVALVLKPEAEMPVLIPLFEEKQLRALLQSKGERPSDYVNALYAASGSPSLYALLWAPLEKTLATTHTIYFSPSGLLHRLNLGAIALPQPGKGQATLSDRYHLVELGSTRALATPHEQVATGKNALLYGGIQYDMDSTQITNVQFADLAKRGGMGFFSPDSTLRGGDWSYLKWTAVEVGAIEALLSDAGLNTIALRNAEASEESFKNIGRTLPNKAEKPPRILHLATHGFFFPDPKQTPNQQPKNTNRQVAFKISDHPMIRSGLILAGGNHAWKTGKPFRPNLEDGILTAYEISQMNLNGTELVVLSACETGLGDIQGNEGVYGLQRAFKIAGAKYLIMSLWQVPDFQTQELMSSFYSHWIEDKMSVPESFRLAQKAMREKYKDPFLWAGFVLVE